MQEYNLARLLCHLCKRFCVPGSFIPCKTPCCGKLFCNKCLTSQYKYSKSKVSRLPTPMWRCPVCTKKCKCDECCELFKIPRKRHGKRRTAAGKSDSTKSKLSTSGRAATNFYSRADANTVTPLGDKGTHEVLSPAAKRHLPSISLFLEKCGDAQPGIHLPNFRRFPVLSASLYEAMTVSELLKLGSLPIY
eukprot:TRINITY_DN1522_c0_g1_i1.p1 TRINITY_DN1522_c0_g1~~TRINITY_DN1522_c0_g1_i1.p1  ORF type:complete len:191 (-),score=21.38 TRINITY_DN1522_c0_g1_i1:154-726(-)